jgi:hypothetical protein
MENKCETCVFNRLVVSENGYHYNCCRSIHKTMLCLAGKANYYIRQQTEVKDDE